MQRAVRLGNRLAMLTALLIFDPSHKLILKRWIIGAISDIGWEEIPIVWGSYGTDRPSTFTSSPLAPLRRICVLCSLSGNILIWSLCFYKTGQDLFGPWVICVSTCSQITVKMRENCCQIMHWRFLSGRLYIWSQGFDQNWNCLLGAVCFLFWSIKNSCTMSWNKIHVGHNAFNLFHILRHLCFSYWYQVVAQENNNSGVFLKWKIHIFHIGMFSLAVCIPDGSGRFTMQNKSQIIYLINQFCVHFMVKERKGRGKKCAFGFSVIYSCVWQNHIPGWIWYDRFPIRWFCNFASTSSLVFGVQQDPVSPGLGSGWVTQHHSDGMCFGTIQDYVQTKNLLISLGLNFPCCCCGNACSLKWKTNFWKPWITRVFFPLL